MLDAAYQKTEAGRAEIKARTLPLSRSARNLLLMLDGTRSARTWLEMIRGTTEADLDFLLEHGLIAKTAIAGGAAAPAAAAPTAKTPAAAAPEAVVTAAPVAAPPAEPPGDTVGFDELYTYLTEHARQHLGLIKGYRMVLDVERCTDLAELRELAWKVIAEIDRTSGEAEADRVRAEMRL